MWECRWRVVPPVLAALAGGAPSTVIFLAFFVVLALHLIAMNVLYPKLVGARVHLNPLVVTFSLMFWGFLWDAAGLVLAIPITAGIKAVCDNVAGLRPYGRFLGRLSCIRLFDRLKERARATRRRIVFPEGDDERVIAAARRLKEEGLADPVLISKNTVFRTGNDLSCQFAAACGNMRRFIQTYDGPPKASPKHGSRRDRPQTALLRGTDGGDGSCAMAAWADASVRRRKRCGPLWLAIGPRAGDSDRFRRISHGPSPIPASGSTADDLRRLRRGGRSIAVTSWPILRSRPRHDHGSSWRPNRWSRCFLFDERRARGTRKLTRLWRRCGWCGSALRI